MVGTFLAILDGPGYSNWEVGGYPPQIFFQKKKRPATQTANEPNVQPAELVLIIVNLCFLTEPKD